MADDRLAACAAVAAFFVAWAAMVLAAGIVVERLGGGWGVAIALAMLMVGSLAAVAAAAAFHG